MLRSISLSTIACLLPLLASASSPDTWRQPLAAPAPPENQPTPERIELGLALFFDTRLSAKGVMSCASCHNPALGWSDARPTAVGYDMKILGRATPTIINAAFNNLQMWDGRKASLEDQALGPFAAADEQNLPLDQLEQRVRGIPGYAPLFARAYPGQEISRHTIAMAIASFERTVIAGNSPFDRWIAGDDQALNGAAKFGFEVFSGKGKCALCHQGFNFSDNGFHNIGLRNNGSGGDLGRFAHRKVAVLRGAFKTPTLRDIGITAPYMHDGSYATLEEVVEHYDRGGDNMENLDANMQPLSLTPAEKHALVEFMRALTSAPKSVTIPALPQ